MGRCQSMLWMEKHMMSAGSNSTSVDRQSTSVGRCSMSVQSPSSMSRDLISVGSHAVGSHSMTVYSLTILRCHGSPMRSTRLMRHSSIHSLTNSWPRQTCFRHQQLGTHSHHPLRSYRLHHHKLVRR